MEVTVEGMTTMTTVALYWKAAEATADTELLMITLG